MLVKDYAGNTVDTSRFWIEVDRDESGETYFYVCCEHCRDYFFVERVLLFASPDMEKAFLVLEKFRADLKAEKAENISVS